MSFSNDGVDWTDWYGYATSFSWVLPTGDGTKTVFVQFKDADLELRFIQTGPVSYPQLRPDFVPNLSIIDMMMFNDRPELGGLLREYALV
jgi:hypothetical protein